jgi:hypothetical protein
LQPVLEIRLRDLLGSGPGRQHACWHACAAPSSILEHVGSLPEARRGGDAAPCGVTNGVVVSTPPELRRAPHAMSTRGNVGYRLHRCAWSPELRILVRSP